jgi:uncharacterized membrane protein YbhN (UPF0104 family)
VPVLRRFATSRALRWGLVVCAVALAVVALMRYWNDVRHAAVELSAWSVAGALLAVVVGIGATMLSWRRLLADLGSPLPVPAAALVFFLAQLGKYVPGSIWPFVAQVELGREHGVPRRRSATTSLLVVAVSVVTGLLLSVVTLPFVSGRAADRYAWLLAAAPVLAVLLHPRILNPTVSWLLRRIRRPALEHPLTWHGILGSAAWSLLGWVAFGAHIWLLVRGLGATGSALLTSLGAYPLAWTVGVLVVFAPAGHGAREVALAAALAPILGPGQVVLVVVVSRLLMTVGDLLWAGVGFVLGRRHAAEVQDELAEAERLRAAVDEAPL